MTYISKFLPTTGFYCVCKAIKITDKTGKVKDTYQQRFFESPAEAEEYIKILDDAKQSVFIAQCTFATPTKRLQENTLKAKAFWLDIDCGGPKDPFKTQVEGCTALKKFCSETGLPIPTITSSGYGLYAHWILTEEINTSQWKGVAQLLKALTIKLKFEICQARTSDTSSVLRPIGAHNRKAGGCKDVKLIYEAQPISFLAFSTIIGNIAKAIKLDVEAVTPPKVDAKLNAEFIVSEGPPSNPDKVAQQCNQIKIFQDPATSKTMSEPLWYSLLGVIKYCEKGEETVHKWSAAYPGYNQQETQGKLDQHHVGPSTCEYIGRLNPSGCIGCCHSGKITSPIQLGKVFEKVKVEDGRATIPRGFELTKNGIIFKSEQPVIIYPYDFYPTMVAFDESLGYEIVRFRHANLQGEYNEFTIRSSAVHDKKSLLMILHDNHVQVVGSDEKNLMVVYMEKYIAKLRERSRMVKLVSQMGWKKEEGRICFVLGDTVFKPGEAPEQIGLARSIPDAVKAFKEEGDLHKWIDATRNLAQKGYEGHAFALLVGGFGSPLLHFTGYSGVMISTVGKSGIGKTLMGKWALSVYGDWDRLMLRQEDTVNSQISRMGLFGNLPIIVDEMSSIEDKAMSRIAYQVTQGRDKMRLDKNAVEKTNVNHWKLVALVSSNHSLIEKLSNLKGDASAEINRVFEYEMEQVEGLTRKIATEYHNTISNNYGGVGKIYLQYLIDHYDEHSDSLTKIQDMVERRSGCKPESRYWVAAISVALYAGIITNKIGLTSFNMNKITAWAIDQISVTKSIMNENTRNYLQMLGDFLAQFANHIIVVNGDLRKNTSSVMKVPTGEVVGRYDIHLGKLFVKKDKVKEWLGAKYASIRSAEKELVELAVLTNTAKIKNLCSGLGTVAGVNLLCWELDMTSPMLGNVAINLVAENKIIQLEERRK